MKLNRIVVVCLGATGFLGTAAVVQSEEQIIKLQRPMGVYRCPSAPAIVNCTVTVPAAGNITPNFSAETSSSSSVNVLLTQKETDREQWIKDNSFSVYRTEETYNKSEVYNKDEVYNRSDIDTTVNEIHAEIAAKLNAIKVSTEDKEDILASVKISMQATIDTLRQNLTDEITKSIRDELKAAGVLK